MELCSDGHEEVCYESRNCPACEVEVVKNRQIENLEKEVADLVAEVDELSSAGRRNTNG